MSNLPKSFAIKSSDDTLWPEYIKWLNNYLGVNFNSKTSNVYYGIDINGNPDYWIEPTMFGQGCQIITLQEWFLMMNERPSRYIVKEKYINAFLRIINITQGQLNIVFNHSGYHFIESDNDDSYCMILKNLDVLDIWTTPVYNIEKKIYIGNPNNI